MGMDAKADDNPFSPAPPRGARLLLYTALLAAVYYPMGLWGLKLGFLNANASAVWPPTGIALAAVLLLGNRVWPGIWVGAFLVNLTTELNLPQPSGLSRALMCSAAIAFGNTAEALLGGWLVVRFAQGRRAFQRAGDVLRFMLLAATLSTAVSATVGATSVTLFGFAPPETYGPLWLTWWLGDMVSAVVITPFLVIWSRSLRRLWSPRRIAEALLVMVALAFPGALVFGGLLPAPLHQYPLGFLVFPPLLLAAYRFGERGAIAAALLLSATALWGTLQDLGPFFVEDRNAALLIVQAFIGTITVTSLVLGAVVSERRRTEDELRESESHERLRAAELQAMTEQLKSLNATLEDRVARRTAELQKRATQLAGLTSELTLAEERERRRLAQILHDHLQQLLVAGKLTVEVTRAKAPPELSDSLKHIQSLLNEAIDASRSLTIELSPPVLHEAGLGAGLGWLGQWMRDKHGLTVAVSVDESVEPTREEVRLLLFQSVREALFNVVKHAGVKAARVHMKPDGPGCLCVVVSDEGSGFDPAESDRSERGPSGFGLFSVRERLRMLGGHLEIDSRPGHGTRVTMIAPSI